MTYGDDDWMTWIVSSGILMEAARVARWFTSFEYVHRIGSIGYSLSILITELELDWNQLGQS